ncbi:hypothetical protein D0Y65_000267 [Glycine soja]|uniref:Uncharacterized protein n=1 Tax=Glycine soja TaxID=3848 RepID=A0A445LY15_GLYSO|nr:hypothetical protein D0Y65_000267 [Glycine soja]
MGSLFQLCFFGVEGHHHPHSASAQSATLRRRFPSLPQSCIASTVILATNLLYDYVAKRRALPLREPFQKFSKARAEPRPKRGFGNSFQPAIDAPRLEPH